MTTKREINLILENDEWRFFIMILTISTTFFILISFVEASPIADVTIGDVVELGDFFYQDNGDPYVGQCCKIYIFYPNGTLAVDGENMTNGVKGTSFNNFSYTPTVLGHHAVVMSCNFGVCSADPGPVNQSRSFTAVGDTNPPSLFNQTPGANQSFLKSSSRSLNFTVSVTDAETSVNTVFFIKGSSQIRATEIGTNLFEVTEVAFGGVGRNIYFWRANDSVGNIGTSEVFEVLIVDPATQGTKVIIPPVIVPKNFTIKVSPDNITDTYLLGRLNSYIIEVENLADDVNVTVDTSLFDFFFFDGHPGTDPFIFKLNAGQKVQINATFAPINQKELIGEIRFKNSLGETKEKIQVILVPSVVFPISQFTGSLLRGSFDASPLILGMFGSYVGIPKIFLFLIPALAITYLALMGKEGKERRSKIALIIMLTILFLIVALFIPIQNV